MTLPKHAQAATIVRDGITAGTLRPGGPAPSGAELARATGFAQLTCRRALRSLLKDGTLVPGPSPNSRLRVASGGRALDPGDALSAALAARRRAAGLTQPELAALVGRSVTTVGHAETGRLWQSRQFWENADRALSARGELLRAHDAYRAATTTGPAPAPDTCPPTDRTAAVIIPAPASLDDQDPAVLNLLRLAAEAIISHPDAVPADLLSLVDAYAADLYGTPPPDRAGQPPPGPEDPARRPPPPPARRAAPTAVPSRNGGSRDGTARKGSVITGRLPVDAAYTAAAATAYAQLRTPWGRSEALADLAATHYPPPAAPPGASAVRRLAILPARARHGRPLRLAARTLAAAAVAALALAVIPGSPSAPAIIAGCALWLAFTAPADLAPPPGR